MPDWAIIPEPPAGVRRQDAFLVFRAAVREVWSNADFVLPHVDLSGLPPINNSKSVAQVEYRGTPSAMGDSIFRRASFYKLHIADRFFDFTPAEQRRFLIHEAVHLGIANHGADFRAKVRKHGGTVSEESLKDPVSYIEEKVGARYKRIAPDFEDEQAAIRAAHELARQNPAKRYRVSLGGL